MKKLFIILSFILIFFFKASAQYKTMFPTDSITWIHTVEVWDAAINKWFEYKGQIDTIKGNPVYYIEPASNGYSHIREDLVEGKTWLINTLVYDTIEFLLMDMSLEIGDSTLYNYSLFSYDSTYVKVVNIYTVNNRKIIEFDSPNNFLVDRVFGDQLKLKFIEGIGPNFGFFEYRGWPRVLCNLYHQDSLVYALDTIGQSCPTWTDVENYIIKQNVLIYPNPFESNLNVEFLDLNLLPCQFFIYDISGKVLLHQELKSKTHHLNLPNIDGQVLLYEFKNEDHRLSGKLLTK